MFHFVISPVYWVTPFDEGTIYEAVPQFKGESEEIKSYYVCWMEKTGIKSVPFEKEDVDYALEKGIWIKTDEHGN